MQFEIYTGEDGQHYARLVARNGQILFASEGYTRRADALHVCELAKEHAAAAQIIVTPADPEQPPHPGP